MHGDFEGAAVKCEEQIAGLDDLAVAEMDLLDQAGNTGTQFYPGGRLESGDMLLPFRQVAPDGLSDGDSGGSRGLLSLCGSSEDQRK
ncbi:hypothetical protein HMPREF9946_03207 [Acetobacteraceae bacterium AT-5844]|nr:hypothetical protein HMPREF9946_03207 [Acetobacteraceae bacterium AT-5844]